ncbi:MAG TPA: c-type cytochrome [Rhizomicrobium sp.]|jgi:cytochrome c553|nr:c-type cytochrome [Rhizomicrobium sp.]
MRLAMMMAMMVCLAASSALAAEPPAEITKCQACHGRDGNSPGGDTPRLNGQSWLYIANRVRSFRDVTKQSAHATKFMFDVNSGVSDAVLLDLARYFAAQPPTTAAPAGKPAEEGRRLYQEGDGKNVPACQVCHGATGEGGGANPRLNGQHAVYLRRQLESFSLLTRVNQTMNPHARDMSADQILALVAYLARD